MCIDVTNKGNGKFKCPGANIHLLYRLSNRLNVYHKRMRDRIVRIRRRSGRGGGEGGRWTWEARGSRSSRSSREKRARSEDSRRSASSKERVWIGSAVMEGWRWWVVVVGKGDGSGMDKHQAKAVDVSFAVQKKNISSSVDENQSHKGAD